MRIPVILLISVLAASCQTSNQPASTSSTAAVSSELSPQAILATMKKVADWQLVHPSPSADRYTENAWTYGAFYAGVMALGDIAGTGKYHDAMVAMGKKFDWQSPSRRYHADDQCVCQTYLELYLKDHDPAMLKPTREKLDYILAHPSTNDLRFVTSRTATRWSWCDSLFMAPPAWV